jgi:uncharacterized protein YjbI with pentapeptide repeats/beta-lactamase regulating signal transducer with metallopeptidase domain
MTRLDLVDSFAGTIVSALGAGVLEAAAFAAVVYFLARMSRTSATTRHVLWWIALAAAAAFPLASVAGSLGRIEHHARVTAFPAEPSEQRLPFRRFDSPTTAHVVRPGGEAQPVSEPVAAANPFAPAATAANDVAAFVVAIPHLAAALVALWLTVTVALLSLLGRSLVSLAAIKRAALPLDESIVRRLRRWRHSTRLGRTVELRVSNEVDVPVAVGFRTPTILLPVRVVEMEEIADLDQIAMHEYAHLDRYDDWTNLAQRIVERIFWFNPVVLFAGRRISLEREIACDDWVVAQTGRAHRYATCLWKLVESSRFPMRPIVAPGALLSAKQITQRIEQLLDSRRNALPRLSPLGAIGLGALAIALVVVQAERAPVIAIADEAPVAPALAAAPAPAPSPVAAPVAAPTLSPLAPPDARVREARHTIVVHVAESATPQAIASAIARALSDRDRVDVKAIVDRDVRVAADSPAHVAVVADAAAPAQAARTSAVAPVAPVAPVAAAASAAAVADAASRAASVGEQTGIDLAKSIATTVATSVVNGVVGGTWNDRTPAKLDRATLARCLGCDLHDRDLRGIDLHGVSLSGVDLHGADLRGVDLGAASLIGVNLRGAKLDGANLSGASMTGCDLGGASLVNANLDNLQLVGTDLHKTAFGGSRMRSIVNHCIGCDFRGFDLSGQDLHSIELVGADLRGADLRNANLRHAKLQGVDLRGARLDGANLGGADFVGCDLSGVDPNGLDGATIH